MPLSTSISFTTCLFDISIHVGFICLHYIPSNNHGSVENDLFWNCLLIFQCPMFHWLVGYKPTKQALEILLMATRNPARVHQLREVGSWNLIHYSVFFAPSQVVQDFRLPSTVLYPSENNTRSDSWMNLHFFAYIIQPSWRMIYFMSNCQSPKSALKKENWQFCFDPPKIQGSFLEILGVGNLLYIYIYIYI